MLQLLLLLLILLLLLLSQGLLLLLLLPLLAFLLLLLLLMKLLLLKLLLVLLLLLQLLYLLYLLLLQLRHIWPLRIRLWLLSRSITRHSRRWNNSRWSLQPSSRSRRLPCHAFLKSMLLLTTSFQCLDNMRDHGRKQLFHSSVYHCWEDLADPSIDLLYNQCFNVIS